MHPRLTGGTGEMWSYSVDCAFAIDPSTKTVEGLVIDEEVSTAVYVRGFPYDYGWWDEGQLASDSPAGFYLIPYAYGPRQENGLFFVGRGNG